MKKFLLLFLVPIISWASTFDSPTFVGPLNAANTSSSIPMQTGLAANKPSCTAAGMMYYATDATAGQNLYYCNGSSWTQQLNSGGGGSPNWVIKTTTYTASAGDYILANTTGGAFTINLPAGSANNTIYISDYNATWTGHNLTVHPNGSDKIQTVNANVIFSTNNADLVFIYVDSTVGWTLVNAAQLTGQVFTGTINYEGTKADATSSAYGEGAPPPTAISAFPVLSPYKA